VIFVLFVVCIFVFFVVPSSCSSWLLEDDAAQAGRKRHAVEIQQ